MNKGTELFAFLVLNERDSKTYVEILSTPYTQKKRYRFILVKRAFYKKYRNVFFTKL